MVRQFAKLGIQLEVRATDNNQFQDKVRKGKHQVFWTGWLADYPDAENFLFLLYGPNAKSVSRRREHLELREPRVRQALRADEDARRRPAEAGADRQDGRTSCRTTRPGASASSRTRRPPCSTGSTTPSRDPDPRPRPLPARRLDERGARRPSGTSPSGGRWCCCIAGVRRPAAGRRAQLPGGASARTRAAKCCRPPESVASDRIFPT